jgi:hypothetical protein
MWSRVRAAHIKRLAQVRLRVHRRDPDQRLALAKVTARKIPRDRPVALRRLAGLVDVRERP